MSELDTMMVNIVESGKEECLRWVETISDPIKRYNVRATYYEALRRLEDEKNH